VRGWGVYKDYGRLIASSGLAAVIPDKRFTPAQSAEVAAEDTLDLLGHIRRNAVSYGVDAGHICLWTFSAGGSLAYLGIQPENGLACVVSYYGLGSTVPRPALQQHASQMPPLLLVRAGRDNAQLNNVIDLFASLALALNAPVTIVNYAAGLHAFEIEDVRPETKEPSNVAEAERILRLTIDWIRDRVSAGSGK
jgi:dienelactone hydrolase